MSHSSDVHDPSNMNDDAEVFIFPTSFAQQRLWLIDQLEPGRATYNIPFNVRLTGALDVRAIEAALTYIVERHEALRTVFDAPDGTPTQVVLPPENVTVPIVDLSSISDATEKQSELSRVVDEEGNRPFDLRTGPVIRATVVRLSADEHVLLITAHHIAVDGWSLGVLQRELSSAYGAFARGEEPALPELPIQYADFALWQRDRLEGAVLDEQLAYWTKQLRHPLPVLDVPTDRPRGRAVEHLAERVVVEVPADASDALAALCRSAGATPFMGLLAVYQELLRRYSGQDDIIVGSPIAGRTRRETEGLIGFFVNTLAIRTDVSGTPTFRELLDRVRTTALAALANQDLPFEKIVEVIQPERDRSRNPVFQTLFSLQDLGSVGSLSFPGLEASKLAGSRETAKFELQLLMNTTPRGYRGLLEYDADLFDAATAEQFARHFATLVSEAAANPDRPVAQLPLLSVDERRQIVGKWNATDAPYPDTALVHELYQAQVTRTPDAIAVSYETEHVTYAQLDARVTALAARLRTLGVAPDARVAICMDRSVDMIVAVLAVLTSGGAYVPVDPAYPAARVSYMLENADVKAVLLSRSTQGKLPAHSAPTIVVDGDATVPGSTDNGSPMRPAPEHLAYVIYTSGSTGMPKGVAMPHRPLVNLLAWQERQSGATVGTRTLQFSSLSFDVSFQEIFSTLTTGGTLVLVSEDVRRDPEALLRLIDDAQVERIFLPYIALQHLADAAAATNGGRSLREVITAGEQLRVTPSVQQWFERLGGCTLSNQYGPTESHVVTALLLDPVRDGSPSGWPELPSIGRPIDNTAIYILDGMGEPVPVGVSGELFIGGVALARGYLNAPERTAERFVRDPFRSDPAARMYKTGDLAKFRRDGTIEYLGRGDGQVKVRGFRIELGEIESVLSRSTDVAACAVTVREDEPGNRRLVAYVVAAPSAPKDAAALRALCKAELPEFMTPAAVVFLDALPLTPSGKVDRRSLPAPAAESESSDETYVAPRTPLEVQIAAIWADVLRLARVGVQDNFFEAGGHSLLATRMVSRVRDQLRREVPLRILFDHPVLGDFVAALERESPANRPADAGRIAAVPRDARRVSTQGKRA